jgi:hypothetical protein
MITDAVVQALLAALSALLTLLPATGNLTLGSGVDTSVMGWVGAANSFVPLVSILQVLVLLAGVQLLLMAWDLAVWVYHQIWGSD